RRRRGLVDRPLGQPLRGREEHRRLAWRDRLYRGDDRATCGRRHRRLEVRAAVDHVAGSAEGLRGPLGDEVGLEVLDDLLLLERSELLLDLALHLRERLGARRMQGLDLDRVEAALSLERTDDLLRRRREHLLLERRLALALGV